MESKRLTRYSQARDVIQQIESNFPVSSIRYQGENCWDAIIAPLCKVSRTILGEDGRVVDPKQSQSIPIFNEENFPFIEKGKNFNLNKDLGEILISSNNHDTLNNTKIDILVLDAPHDYSKDRSNKFFNKNNDGLARVFPKKRIVYFLPRDNKLLSCPFKRETMLYQRSSLVNGIIERFHEPITGLKELLLFMKANNYPFLKSYDELSGIIKTVIYKSNQFASFFEKYKVKCLFTSGFRGVERMAFILAANKAGVKTIEYQHGVLGPEHFNIDLSKDTNELIPKYFWVYGDKFRKQISKQNKERFILGGKINLVSKNHKSRKKRSITVMQAHTQSNVVSFCKKLASMIKNHNNLDVALRLHPRSHHLLDKYEKQLRNYNVAVRESTLSPVENILSSSKYVIVEESTVAYEADFFGATPIVLGKNGLDIFSDEIKSGRFVYANKVKEIADIINKFEINKITSMGGVAPLVSKREALQNIKSSSAFK